MERRLFSRAIHCTVFLMVACSGSRSGAGFDETFPAKRSERRRLFSRAIHCRFFLMVACSGTLAGASLDVAGPLSNILSNFTFQRSLKSSNHADDHQKYCEEFKKVLA